LEPFEVEYEDTTSVFPIVTEEFRTFFNNLPVSVTLRRELFIILGSLIKDLEGKEYALMKKAQENVQAFEKEYCLTIAENFPVLTFEKQ
jgi:hypothetical protein